MLLINLWITYLLSLRVSGLGKNLTKQSTICLQTVHFGKEFNMPVDHLPSTYALFTLANRSTSLLIASLLDYLNYFLFAHYFPFPWIFFLLH